MIERKPDQLNIVDELKEFGRQLTVTIKAVAASEQVRSLGHDLKDGLSEAAENVEAAWSKVRERDEMQRLQARAADVAESFKTGEAQQEIREEIRDALHALNVRLSALVERLRPTTNDVPGVYVQNEVGAAPSMDASYTGTTRKLES